MNTKLTKGLMGLGAMLLASQVNAATVSLTPSSTTVSISDSFSLDLAGTGFDAGATTASINLTWDASILTLTSATMASGLQSDGTGTGGTYAWDTLGGTAAPGSFDIGAFFTDTALFGDPFPVAGPNFDLMTINFTVIGEPATNPSDVTVLSSAINGDWLDANNNPITDTIVFENATVTVNPVPVPAAVWLFGSGLIGLVGIARRKTQLA